MSCSLCAREIKKGESKLCYLCQRKLHDEAVEMQEKAYLARWLNTRLDEFGNVHEGMTIADTRQTRRLRRKAKHVNWQNPPTPLKFDGYVKLVAERHGLSIGRGRKAEKAS